MVINQTEEQEKEYLANVIRCIKNTMINTDRSVKEHVDTLQEYKEYLWSNKDIDPHEIRSMRESIINHFAIGESVIDKRKRLIRILDIPYFGRIDFKENDKESVTAPVYIGTYTFYDTSNKTNIIYDWRAPISGMFYDYELGEATYDCPQGKVVGNISLKRQYRVRNGKMEYMIESSITVQDEVLQRELRNSADDKMKNIVATIQREQNRIIRNEEAHTLIIQGVAGSGKTSIALHRIAWLLYTFKDTLSSKDILIVSPNKVFADYISEVIPELGEERVPETSMEQILSGVLENKYKYQNFFEQVTELLTQPTSEFIERIRYKSSFEILSQLDRFILYIENNYFNAIDVQLTKYITIPAGFIEEQFRRFNRYPMRRRFETMAHYILEMMKVKYGIVATTAEQNLLKKQIRNMFIGNNDLQLYKDFFKWVNRPELFRIRKNRVLEYADLAPLAYLHLSLEGNPVQTTIKHLLIDEMQDYSPVQYRVIQKLYPCRKTILGDTSQSINPYGSSDAEMINKAFVTGEIMKLCKSYRSTYEITSFAQEIRFNAELEPIIRHGKQPEIIGFKSKEEEEKGIINLISSFRKSVYQSLGIICKTELQAQQLTERLKQSDKDIYFLSHQCTAFVKGVIITSAHMAKGLEFDEVILPDVSSKNYYSEIDHSMLYVGVTRAMHQLTLTYTDKLSILLKE